MSTGWFASYDGQGAIELRVQAPSPAEEDAAVDAVMTFLSGLGLRKSEAAKLERRLHLAAEESVTVSLGDLGVDSPPRTGANASACVIVASDGLSAWLIGVTSDARRIASAFDIVDALNRAGVTTGFEEKVIRRLDGQSLTEPVPVAQGRPSVDGREAEIVIDLGRTDGDSRDTATVDFRQVGHDSFIGAGTLLAHKVAATAGVAGQDVFGGEIVAADGADRDLGALAGDNTELADHDGLENAALVASIDGNVRASAKSIKVEPLLIIPHDVDFRTGNIDFPGTVHVQGDVAPGFELKAAEAVDVRGSVTGATVIADGDVTVAGGFLADAEGHSGRIQSGGSVRVAFADGGAIQAQFDIIAAREIVRSQIYAGGSVRVEGSGHIRGAQIIAGLDVEAGAIGGRLGSRTVLVAGSRSSLADLEPILNNMPPAELIRPADTSRLKPAADAASGTADQIDDVSAQPHITARSHIEPGSLIMVGAYTLRPETRLHHCRIVEGTDRLNVLPL